MSTVFSDLQTTAVPTAAHECLLEVEDLHVHFVTTRGVVRAVEGLSYRVRTGEVVALVGESGCGKSVSALAILRLLARPAGRIVGGQHVAGSQWTGRRFDDYFEKGKPISLWVFAFNLFGDSLRDWLDPKIKL